MALVQWCSDFCILFSSLTCISFLARIQFLAHLRREVDVRNLGFELILQDKFDVDRIRSHIHLYL